MSSIEHLFICHFGLGSEQFERELEIELQDASPEQRAEFDQLVEQANAIIPELNATLDEIASSLDRVRSTVCDLSDGMAALNTRVADIENRLQPVGIKAGK